MEKRVRGTTMENNEKSDDEPAEINYRGWKAMPFVIGNETFEKLGAIGTLSNLLIYLTTVFHMKSIEAANILNIFGGTSNLATLVGAFLSDTYFGRCNTLGFASLASFLGLVALDLTAVFKKLHPPQCGVKESDTCKGPTTGQMAFLITGFGLLTVGAGGIRPCNLAFGADQFNPNTESGKKGIDSFFNWYFFTLTVAQMISLTLVVYVQSNVSWALGLAIPAIFMLISCALFFMGLKIFVKVKAMGSPITSVAQVVVVAIKKRTVKLPDQPWLSLFNYTPPNSINSKLPYTHQFRFLDKAAVVTPQDQVNQDGSAADPWRLCSIQQVEEVKCVLRVMPIWFAAVIYHVAIVQLHTFVVFQALQSDRRVGSSSFQIPAASYYVFMMLSLSIWIAIYDRIVVPLLRKLRGKQKGNITLLQRMGIGIFLSIVSLLVSGLVEDRRRTTARTKPTLGIQPRKGAISSMSALWLVPQLVVVGISDAFTAIAQLEFYYKQFPENMRSVAGSLFFCGMAVSSYLSSFLITIVHRTTQGPNDERRNWLHEDLNQGRLDYFYYMIGALEVVNLAYFLVCSKWYKYKGLADSVTDGAELETKEHQKAVV